MMCFAIPAKVLNIDGMKVGVDCNGELREVVNLGNIEISVGDYVLISAGVIVKKMQIEEARKFFNILENAQQ